MIDARILTTNLDKVKTILEAEKAELKGRYVIHDTIYRNIDGTPVAKEFLRLRKVLENIWDEKPFLIALKQTELRKIGKRSQITIKLEFDSFKDAEDYYEANFKKQYIEDFDFRRVGWQYFMPNGDVIDLEIVENKYPTIEFKSETDAGLRRLLEMFAISDEAVIKGPSILAIRELLDFKG